MDAPIRAVTWEAPTHYHTEKTSDWFWVLGILALSASVAAFFFGNYLLAILIILAAGVVSLIAAREPRIVTYIVSNRGIRISDEIYPYGTLDAYYIDEDDPDGPKLLLRSSKMFMHLLVCPVPEEYLDEIETILESRLPEEFLEEPLATKLLELAGF